MNKFCDIQTRNDLADFLKVPRSRLTYVLYIQKTDRYYETFDIPKKSGGTRTICAPAGELKDIQKRLAMALWTYQSAVWKEKKSRPNLSHAFEKDKSIITNARIHRNKRLVLNFDLENFFAAFHFGRVQGFFEKNRDFQLPREAAITIAQIACYNGSLPQGAPSSPIITNLICQILDLRLWKVAKAYKLDYTRYADDLTFSTNDHTFLDVQKKFCAAIFSEIERAGFTVNHKKTRLLFRDSKQEVTGLVVNKKVSVDRAYCKKTRAMAHRLYTQGEYEIDGKPATLKQLEGRFSFIDQIDHYNNRHDGKTHNAHTLNGREQQYQAFLFYKYFFSNDKPIIVTEGKTDVLYLKAALKKLYKEYPNLVGVDSEGNFSYKVSFFRRSKRWKYFFGLSLDGADAMKNLYGYFTRKNPRNYLEYFQKLCGGEQQNPVILLFDNETETKRPLKEFLKNTNLSEDDKKSFKKALYVQLVPNSKLFLLTNPLISGKAECEIEDLFPQDVLEHKIDGKTFTREDRYDVKKYYGKEIFSKYVSRNYKNIDFSKFRALLDALNLIVDQH